MYEEAQALTHTGHVCWDRNDTQGSLQPNNLVIVRKHDNQQKQLHQQSENISLI